MGKSRTFSKERRMVSLHSLLLKTIFVERMAYGVQIIFADIIFFITWESNAILNLHLFRRTRGLCQYMIEYLLPVV